MMLSRASRTPGASPNLWIVVMMTLRAPAESSSMQFGAGVGRDQAWDVGCVECPGDLGVQVDAVDHDEDRGVAQPGHRTKLERGEHHEQRLARALEVPDQTLLDLAKQHPVDDQVGCLELLEPGDDLDLAVLLVGGVDA